MQRNKGKTPGKTRGRLDLLGLYNHGAGKTAAAPRGRAGKPLAECPSVDSGTTLRHSERLVHSL